MYTKVQIKQYGVDCFDAGLNYEPELQSSPKVTKTSELAIDDLLRMFGGLK